MKLLKPGGKVYLPFHIDIISALAFSKTSWESYYDFVLVHEGEIQAMHENLLWAATESIDRDTMVQVFGKEPGQENTYCKMPKRALKELPKSSNVVELLLGVLDNIEQFRFICLHLKPEDAKYSK